MKWLAATSYALAAAAGSGAMLSTLVIAGCVFVGTVCLVLAVRNVVQTQLRDLERALRTDKPTSYPWSR